VYNFAASLQWSPILGHVEDEIVNCFKLGGGVPYSSYKRFHEVMEEESAQTVLSVLFESIIPLVPDLEDRLTKGINVLDIGCGNGRVMNMMANRFPHSRFTGYDISQEAIKNAQYKSLLTGNYNVDFTVKDVSKILGTQSNLSFDLITAFDAIHDQAECGTVLKNIFSLLKPGKEFFIARYPFIIFTQK